jgi:UDP-3-O-[3-hydroxymyristoyl] N-acetylglucosamine deacetylase
VTWRRRTVRRTVRLRGRGLHSGEPVEVAIHPGGDGLAFHHRGTRVAAVPANVTATRRCTRLGPVATVEHLMSALAGAGVTDAEIAVTAPELPGCDGSAAPFLDALAACGLEELGPARPAARLERPITFARGCSVVRISPGTGRWHCVYDLAGRWPGRQALSVRLPADYAAEVAPARTLVLAEELAAARREGLGRGLGAGSVVVIGAHGYDGVVRFPDEPVRHKLLDLVGDLYLAGLPVHELDVTAVRCGHTANVMAARLLADAVAEGALAAAGGREAT